MKTSACGKIILVGEHAVVYGVPGIAVPLNSVRAYVTVHSAASFTITAEADPHFRLSAQDEHPFVQLAHNIAQAVSSALPNIRLHIQSEIPVASGLGSGAAIATALGRALLAYLSKPMPLEDLNALVYESETYYHGTPSGIDNTVIVYEQPVYFERGKPIQLLSDFRPFTLVVANTGIQAPTREAVADVRRLYESDQDRISKVFASIAEVVRTTREALAGGDWATLGAMFNRNHQLLCELTVSCAELDALVERARESGALGAKLSGGGRGGNMIALVEPTNAYQVEAALQETGAVWTRVVEVKP